MTLIEIMIVVAIMAAIMGVVGWYVLGQKTKADIDLANTQLKTFQQAVRQYRIQYNKFPDKFEDLVDTPDGVRLIEEVPKDPWGNDYVLESTGSKVLMYSNGPDGTANNDDDVRVEFEM